MGDNTAPVFSLIQGDITRTECDAIMASCNPDRISSLQLAISDAAGLEWEEELSRLMADKSPGDAWVMDAGDLPCEKIYMCMTPIWKGNIWNEERELIHCYKNSLYLCDVEKLAVPLLATGKHRFPDSRAIRLAVQACIEHAPITLKQIVFTALDPKIAALTQDRLNVEIG